MVQLTLVPVVNENLFTKHYLEERVGDLPEWREEEEIKEAFEEIKKIYEKKKSILSSCNEPQLREEFLNPVLRVLDFQLGVEAPVQDSAKQPDYALFKNEDDKLEAYQKDESEDFYQKSVAVADAKAWDVDFDKKTGRGNVFENRNPSFQIYYYLDSTPPDWGFLTNGRKWRLYYDEIGLSQWFETYYEVDLIDILEKDDLEGFKYFYLFFRKDAFTPVGDSFLDKAYQGSERYAQKVGENLEDNVYKALRWMAKGYFDMGTNDLEKTKENVEMVHKNSLIFLYRLIFLLYAESNGLLESSGEIPKKYSKYSVYEWAEELLGEWDRDELAETGGIQYYKLSEIFKLVREGSEKQGIPKEDFYVPAYNGGLFDNQKHPFFDRYKIQDGNLAKVVDLLLRTYSEEDGEKVWVDYSDLSLRHLGGIYEGLLEHQLRVAEEKLVAEGDSETGKWIPASEASKDFSEFDQENRKREGELYLRTDKGERKATGSYYTPDYIVKYIVENTVGPVIEKKLEDAETDEEKRQAILSTNVLDPAMGSGHFLVEAIDFLASRLVEFAENGGEERDIDWAKRKVARNCIYGVDVNPLATELAKVSLWLNTMAEDKPLSFLDHHLKTGNSLIGADVHKLDKHPKDEGKVTETGKKTGQLALSDFIGKSVRDDIKQLLGIYREMLEVTEERPEDIEEQEELFKEFEAHPFKKKFDVLSDVQTSYYFGNEFSKSQYKRLLEAFRAGSEEWEEITQEDWVKKASDSVPKEVKLEDNLSDEKRFFHWKLEFPEVFFNIEEGTEKDNPGFDAVVGNPPWAADIENESYVKMKFPKTSKANDTASYFLELCSNLTEKSYGMIIKNSIVFIEKWQEVRELLYKDGVTKVLNPGTAFKDADIESVAVIMNKDSTEKTYSIDVAKPLRTYTPHKEINPGGTCYSDLIRNMRTLLVSSITEKENEVLQKMSKTGHKFEEIIEDVTRGTDIDEGGSSDICYVRQGPQTERYQVNYCKNVPKSVEKNEKNQKILRKKLFVKPLRGWRLAFCLDSKGNVLTGSNYDNIFLNDGKDVPSMKSLLAILNSRLISFYVAFGIYSKNTETARHLDGAYVGRIPVPNFNLPSPDSADIERVFDLCSKGNFGELNKQFRGLPMDSSFLHDSLEFFAEQIIKNKREVLKESKSFLSWVSREWEVDTENLSRKTYLKEYWEHGFDEDRKSILNIAKHNSSKISGNPSSRKFQEKLEKEWQASVDKLKPLMEDIQDLENQIDALVFKLYELDEEEVITVLDSLETEEEVKQDILEKFRGLNE